MTTDEHVRWFDFIFATPAEKLTAAVAAAGAVTPIAAPDWFERLHQISVVAATLLPILSCTWFVIQIAIRLNEWWEKRSQSRQG